MLPEGESKEDRSADPWLSFSKARNCDNESLDPVLFCDVESSDIRSLDPWLPSWEDVSWANGSLAALAPLRAARTWARMALVEESTDCSLRTARTRSSPLWPVAGRLQGLGINPVVLEHLHQGVVNHAFEVRTARLLGALQGRRNGRLNLVLQVRGTSGPRGTRRARRTASWLGAGGRRGDE